MVRNTKTQRSERVDGNGRGVWMVPEAEPSEGGVANSAYVEGLEEFLSSLHMLAVVNVIVCLWRYLGSRFIVVSKLNSTVQIVASCFVIVLNRLFERIG
ncbi:hypothetical protein J1N35_024505 [Gossypium stocksii]|uniref:Uncharacterized protein n=1 Tax=Gossypium stocksii TaxID=47602 RepID=A0A9D3V4G7_9ROSI|nr:hypothetical protein J1N35_024505 [Gossypium stocksii]